MWYWLFKFVFMGPVLTLLGRPKVEGRQAKNLAAHVLRGVIWPSWAGFS